MKIAYSFLFLIFSITIGCAQQIKQDSLAGNLEQDDIDELLFDPVLLEEVVVYRDKMDSESLKRFMILQNRVYKVYPYAKAGAERLAKLDETMAMLPTKKEKKKYFKIVENYVENEFTDPLKKLSRKQGQILLKLIYRQTGETTYDIVKDRKSGFKAWVSNNTAKLFDLNMKAKYDPYTNNEDYLIETILVRAFENRRLPFQEAHTAVNYQQLQKFWNEKAANQSNN